MELQDIGFVIKDQGQISDYLVVSVEHLSDRHIKLSQPHLIDDILQDVNLSKRSPGKTTPAAPTKILHCNSTSPVFDNQFNYCSVIRKLNFLEKCTCPDISYAVHQCARFSADPRKPHGEAIIHIAKYLQTWRNEGRILVPDPQKSLEVFADADFCGNWPSNTNSIKLNLS
jgi:hypothetical protein